MRFRIEIWKSSQNQQEIHHFLSKDVNGFGNNAYLFGINPKYINKKNYLKILAIVKEGLDV